MHREVLKQYLPTIERSVGGHGADAVTLAARDSQATSTKNIGKLQDGINWFTFGAWK